MFPFCRLGELLWRPPANRNQCQKGGLSRMAINTRAQRKTPTARAVPNARRKRATKSRPPNRLIRTARKKFLHAFPGGFRDETYVEWERDYKWRAHQRWQDDLSEVSFAGSSQIGHLRKHRRLASSIESRTNLLFSFEKMALRDAIRSVPGAKAFACAFLSFFTAKSRPKYVSELD